MIQAFVFDHIAVLVGPWREPADPPEHGARVEVRLRAAEPQRGSYAAAQRVTIDMPMFRADLFDLAERAPGNLAAAHFHEGFDGVEPRDRVWPDGIRDDPLGWLAGQLGDLRMVLARGGADASTIAASDDDAVALKAAIPEILNAVESAWTEVRRPASRHPT
jgi:hypothetical protein